jgi:hypothetical protein
MRIEARGPKAKAEKAEAAGAEDCSSTIGQGGGEGSRARARSAEAGAPVDIGIEHQVEEFEAVKLA